MYPQIIHFNGIFHYKRSILGFSYGVPMVWGTAFKLLKGPGLPKLNFPKVHREDLNASTEVAGDPHATPTSSGRPKQVGGGHGGLMFNMIHGNLS